MQVESGLQLKTGNISIYFQQQQWLFVASGFWATDYIIRRMRLT